MLSNNVNIKNRKASFEYHLIDKYVAGLQLLGTEIKSVRESKASISEGYCAFMDGELFVRNMHIAEYSHGGFINHEPKRPRKLLLSKQELNKLEKKIKTKGFTIIPTRLFISKNGYAKLEIALAQGKKLYDKRESLKQADDKRSMARTLKNYR